MPSSGVAYPDQSLRCTMGCCGAPRGVGFVPNPGDARAGCAGHQMHALFHTHLDGIPPMPAIVRPDRTQILKVPRDTAWAGRLCDGGRSRGEDSSGPYFLRGSGRTGGGCFLGLPGVRTERGAVGGVFSTAIDVIRGALGNSHQFYPDIYLKSERKGAARMARKVLGHLSLPGPFLERRLFSNQHRLLPPNSTYCPSRIPFFRFLPLRNPYTIVSAYFKQTLSASLDTNPDAEP